MQENTIWEDIKRNFIRNDSMVTKIIVVNTFIFLILLPIGSWLFASLISNKDAKTGSFGKRQGLH